ncbi:helix-turn-helix domain-containing protein [Brenneria tiliae]|uniref:AraC family transcriptional regulator n=1 Tax=Brenneria tiliae TaxID=2914984 RepID=A0ABT0N152_9GAMM|nr:AraC family transcriptional regulator [Brenneria tiliae]MCL2895829.1 AraC family transcriptional regulator [Brenneria tiliae]
MTSTTPYSTSDTVPAFLERTLPELILKGGFSITSGTLNPCRAEWQSEKLIQGLKVVIVESGELLCQFPQQNDLHIVGPVVCTIWNQDKAEGAQCFLPGSDLRYTSVSLSLETLSAHLPQEISARLVEGMRLDLTARPIMRVKPIPNPLQGLQAQLLACPMKGVARQLYLTGKALEIVAHSIETMMPEQKGEKVSVPRLNADDIARLYEAKDILETRLDSPPSLRELSVCVGMNTRKLTVGFRRIFGDSIYSYLQSLRLETAYRLLATGEMSVSKVAYQIGYTPAHLSVAFRKKFGFAPKNMRG